MADGRGGGKAGRGPTPLSGRRGPRDTPRHPRRKTIAVPPEQTTAMEAALGCALLLAEKFGSRIEGFALRPAVAEMVAMDPDARMTMVAGKENDAHMERHAQG